MPNATQMLRQDHKKVEALFNKFEQGKAMDAKRARGRAGHERA